MGVPKFFRWLSERYPKIIQRYGSPPSEETCQEHFGKPPPDYLPPPDPLSTCGLPPEIDRLYIDMNGIIHGCSHNNQQEDSEEEGFSKITEEQIFSNICYYLDRIVRDIAKPNELLYLAIDGVAPRAKLNQQRARRYRSGKEGEIERTVYDAHREALERERELNKERALGELDYELPPQTIHSTTNVTEFEPGRFSGKFETTIDDSDMESLGVHTAEDVFHSNAITPGTPFFQRCCEHLTHFIQKKVSTDPAWMKLNVIFSGPDVPGEGEHKIMQFIREQRCTTGYNPNLRHCIMGQDGDLIMLGLATHEPNLFLLREKVLFDRNRRKLEPIMSKYGLDVYIHNAHFELLHMNILRDYLAFEFETSNVIPDSPFDLERTIDDFVFMTFLIGNDFLPHLPTLDIADEAFDLLFFIYRRERMIWVKQDRRNAYLVKGGDILFGRRLEYFFESIGKYEGSFYELKRETEDLDQARRVDAKFGRQWTPDDDVLEAKEKHDRSKFLQLIENSDSKSVEGFTPVVSNTHLFGKTRRTEDSPGSSDRLGSLAQYAVRDGTAEEANELNQDLKGRYYADKFGFSPFDVDNHLALRKAYIEGLVWNLKYYYEGCVSWEWYYPYHYGPMISDLVNVQSFLGQISFDDPGEPLKPFEQLLACMPPSHSALLPGSYAQLMTDPSSPILDFYPKSFVVDMNGKRWPWEASVLLPFIDSRRLREAVATLDTSQLTEMDASRNKFGEPCIINCCSTEKRSLPPIKDEGIFSGLDECTAKVIPFKESPFLYKKTAKPMLYPDIIKGTEYPLPGLGTLRDGSVQSVWRKLIRVDVHGSPSRYKTAMLELNNSMPEAFPVASIAHHLIGTHIYINYPHLIEALIVAVSDSNGIVRGKCNYELFTDEQSTQRRYILRKTLKSYVFGEKCTGTGGLTLAPGETSIEDLHMFFHVRPLKNLSSLPDGTVGRQYANFEIEVPSFVASWAPVNPDKRLEGKPMLLENDPYKPRRSITSQELAVSSSKKISSDRMKRREKSFSEQNSVLFSQSRGLTTMIGPHPRTSKLYNKRSFFTASQYQTATGRPQSLGQKVVTVTKRPPLRLRGSMLAVGAFLLASMLPGSSASNSFDLSISQSPFSPEKWSHSVSSGQRDSEEFWKRTDSQYPPPIQFAHGTTTLAFTFPDGIIAAVDSRASLGAFVGSKTTEKVLPINSHILGTMAGGAADCMYWIRKLRADAALLELTDGCRMSVVQASHRLSHALYEHRDLGLSIGTMIMGFDERDDAVPRIFYVDNSGMCVESDLFAVGSGSTFALGILDTERRSNMTESEAIALGIKAIRHATFRDAYSGGFINVYLITRDGWKRVFRADVAAEPSLFRLPSMAP